MLDPCLGQADDGGVLKGLQPCPRAGKLLRPGSCSGPVPFSSTAGAKQAVLHQWRSEVCLGGVFQEGKERVDLTYILHIMSRKPERHNGRNVLSFSPPLILSDCCVTFRS